MLALFFYKSVNLKTILLMFLAITNFNAISKPIKWGACCTGCEAPLPITLTAFTGFNAGEKNILQWTTASETNNDYFIIERSIDTLLFIPITTVKGSGNSNTAINYQYPDQLQTTNYKQTSTSNLKPQTSNLFYYRLKQVDFDGNFTYSKIIAIEQNPSNSGITLITPSPAHNNLELFVYSETVDSFRIEIIDIVGRTVFVLNNYVTEGSNNIKLNIENLKSAVYFIRFRTNNGVEYVNKFVK